MTGMLLVAAFLLQGVAPQGTRAPQGLPAPVLQSASYDTSYKCLVCHAEKRNAFMQGVHSQRGIKCADCHGGDPTSDTLPFAHRGNFIGKPTKVQTVALCGSCHSSPNRMRPYGIPTGQVAEFSASQHGKLLLQRHDTAAPTCIDCHDAHTIRRPDDARSTVYPTNIPETCGRCHSDTLRMAKYDIPTDQLERFRKSAHGRALLQDQNFAAPACLGCHGAHSALPPTVREVAAVCGRCHVSVDDAFEQGPHGAAARAGRMSGCLGCHQNHDTERVPPDRIASSCTKCHATGTHAYSVGEEIEKSATQAATDLQLAKDAIARLQRSGRQVGEAEFRYAAAVTAFDQIGEAQHALDLTLLEQHVRTVRSTSRDIQAMVDAVNEHTWEHQLFLGVVWFLALSGIALAWLTLRRLERGSRGS